MENINVQVYSLVSEPISPIEKLKTIAKLGFAGADNGVSGALRNAQFRPGAYC